MFLSPQSDGMGRRALMNTISAHKRGTEKDEISVSLPQVRTQPEVSCLQTRRSVLTRHQSCWHLGLGLLDSRTMRNKYLVCWLTSLWY